MSSRLKYIEHACQLHANIRPLYVTLALADVGTYGSPATHLSGMSRASHAWTNNCPGSRTKNRERWQCCVPSVRPREAVSEVCSTQFCPLSQDSTFFPSLLPSCLPFCPPLLLLFFLLILSLLLLLWLLWFKSSITSYQKKPDWYKAPWSNYKSQGNQAGRWWQHPKRKRAKGWPI